MAKSSEDNQISAENWPGDRPAARRAADKAKATSYKRPKAWAKTLPKQATPKQEVDWVHTNLALVREDRGDGGTRINYTQRLTDPPSHGAVTLLEAAVEDPKWFQGHRLNVLKNVEDAGEMVKRDKMRVDKIEEILGRFDEAGKA